MSRRHPLVAVILAGGVGSRFWPASTASRPKQLLPLGSAQSLIADTVDRAVALVGVDNVRILAGAALAESCRSAVPLLGEENFLIEPETSGTGPALTWAAWEIERQTPGTVMISLHADHVISPFEAFRATVDRAVRAAEERGALVCLGAEPDRPETGFGYVELGRQLGDLVWEVDRFVEKPDLTIAKRYCASGKHLWNTGIFVWRAAGLLEAVQRWTPEVSEALDNLERHDVRGFFQSVDNISVDVGVLERANNAEVVQATFSWDDVGSWNALARTRTPDEAGNVVVGGGKVLDSTNTIVWSDQGHVVVFGVDGLVVVRSAEHTLVTTREAAPDLKRLLDSLDRE
jgi:mannose-1-phosphate guanylyltransferase